ncbi:glycosyltransferase family 39 protein [Spirosoma agri]|uniref:Glycosyltransferase RgtA/B/C/D-like domain-containing protein n=1 Tax=Spirosoma agri TaxID=1987381 RepID=A0A6M0IKF5_9BACT|nr:glycosyltransferase family 39 protein [Spirosoma agri]NEU67861.1 hypothetical protein [Spirosoma agri]
MSLSLAFVISAQFLIGFGICTRLRCVTNGLSLIGLSTLVGQGVSSVLPFVIEFAHLPIARTPVFTGLGLMAVVSLVLLRGQGGYLRRVFSWQHLSLRLYELPFLGFWSYLLVISAWKCAWFPNTPFDMIVGPDLVATFAVSEHTLASSVFTEHLPSVSVFSNQPFYAPFTAMQQLIYLLAAQDAGPFMFGKIWLTGLVISFGLFLYAELRERIHPMVAGTLMTLLACTPELFAYTFLVQTDWANAAFFVAGVLLLYRYVESDRPGALVGSALLLAIACWTRTETIFFVPIGSLVVLACSAGSIYPYAVSWRYGIRINRTGNSKHVDPDDRFPRYDIRARKTGRTLVKGFMLASGYSLVCLIPVLFWNYGFLRGYVPLPPHARLGVFHGLSDGYWTTLMAVFAGMNKQVVFNADYWHYAVPVFLVVTSLNLLVFRDKRGLMFLGWLVGIYVLFGFMILHVDGANIAFTFRRGFFKLLFLMYAYLGTTTLMHWLSGWLYKWEGRTTIVQPR